MRTDVRPISPKVDSALMVAGWSATDLADELDGLSAPQLEDLIPTVARLIARFDAVRLNALAAADRAGVHSRAGMRSTAEWAAAVTGDKPGRVRGDCDLAGKLADLPIVAEALTDGRLSKAQAAAVAGAHAPSDAAQAELVNAASSLSVTELERRVERFNLDHHRPVEPVVPAVVITPTRGGITANVTLDALGGELFSTALDAAHTQLPFAKGTGLAERRAAGPPRGVVGTAHCGDTKLTNIVLLYWHHHHLLHTDHGWPLTLDPLTRRLDVGYRGRPVGTTVPHGRRRRTGPDIAPATPPTAPCPRPCRQTALFQDAS